MAEVRVPDRIAIVGGGKMGEGILGGWVLSDEGVAQDIKAENVVVVEPTESRRAYLTERYGVACVASATEIEAADLVLLAVKPQVMMSVLEGIPAPASLTAREDVPLFVSIAAGMTTARLEAGLPEGARLVRVMPNMALMYGEGATAVTPGTFATSDDVELVRELFGCLGVAVVVEEAAMDAVCAVSGSGPAYVAQMVEAMRDAGVSQGLPFELAEALALQTVYGTALLIKESGQTPEEVRKSICSPGGTTLAALDAMNEAGFARVFDEGVAAAVRRSKELASC